MILTLQTNKRRRSVKAGQITLIESVFHFSVKVHSLIMAFILQLHPDVAPELIEFCENSYHGNLNIHVMMSISVHRVQFRHRHTILVRANFLEIL